MIAVLLCVTGAGAYLGAAVVARHRAQAAADLAALAAASRLPSGAEMACARATAVARRMRVDAVRCEVDGLDVVVTVDVAVAVAGTAHAAARAGPAGAAQSRRVAGGAGQSRFGELVVAGQPLGDQPGEGVRFQLDPADGHVHGHPLAVAAAHSQHPAG